MILHDRNMSVDRKMSADWHYRRSVDSGVFYLLPVSIIPACASREDLWCCTGTHYDATPGSLFCGERLGRAQPFWTRERVSPGPWTLPDFYGGAHPHPDPVVVVQSRKKKISASFSCCALLFCLLQCMTRADTALGLPAKGPYFSY